MKHAVAVLCVLVLSTAAVEAKQTKFHLAGNVENSVTFTSLEADSLHGIAVWSYPSHTLLAVFANAGNDGHADAMAATWIGQKFGSAANASLFPLATFRFRPGISVARQVRTAVPAHDYGLQIDLSGSWGAGIDEKTVRVATDLHHFEFSLTTTLDDEELCCGPETSARPPRGHRPPIRVNLRHVPEGERPAEEPPDPDYDPWAKMRSSS